VSNSDWSLSGFNMNSKGNSVTPFGILPPGLIYKEDGEQSAHRRKERTSISVRMRSTGFNDE
jgi:hypothetical protein